MDRQTLLITAQATISGKGVTCMDYIAEKIIKEIEAKRELIAKVEAAMKNAPENQEQTQEFVLDLMKEQLSKLKEYQQKLESVVASLSEQQKEQ
jgi:hypothetical protein